MQKRFYNMSLGDYEVCLLKLGTMKQEGLSIEEARGESLGCATLTHWKVSEKGALGTGPWS